MDRVVVVVLIFILAFFTKGDRRCDQWRAAVDAHHGFDESAVDDEPCRFSLEMIARLVERARNLGYETVPVAEIGPRTLDLLAEAPAAGHLAAPLPS